MSYKGAGKAQCGVAEAALQEVLSIQNDLTIRAPAKGMITTRMADEGELIAAGSPLFNIVDLDRLYSSPLRLKPPPLGGQIYL